MKRNLFYCIVLFCCGTTNAQIITGGMISGPVSFNPCHSSITTNPFWTSATQVLYSACDDVKVGIGTSNPTHSLHVPLNARFGEAKIDYSIAIGATNPLLMGTKLFHLKANYSHPSQMNYVLFLIENHERPLFQINNQGRIWSRGITVNMEQSWPDYVFSKTYRLRSFTELEEFITKHQHLPNIPNASTVKEEGIDLGEMNRLLLEKIEELTLYVIQLNKTVMNQEQRISSLENNSN